MKNAKKGYELLKRKADALTKKMNELNEELYAKKLGISVVFKDCQLAMAQANFAAGDFSGVVRDSVGKNAALKLSAVNDSAAGVKIPIIEVKGLNTERSDDNIIGITGGGQAINAARNTFKGYVASLIKIAALQFA